MFDSDAHNRATLDFDPDPTVVEPDLDIDDCDLIEVYITDEAVEDFFDDGMEVF